jgi:HlyD family secretion protein
MNEQVPNPDADLARRLGLALKPRLFWTAARIAFAAAAVLVLAAAAGFYFSRDAGAPGFVTAPVVRGPLIVTVSATGTLQPQNQVDVGAEISGRVDRLNVDYNDRVKKGQVLAVINTDQIRAQLAQAQAALNAAKATVANNEATVRETLGRRTRARALFTRGGVSAQDVQTAEAEYDRAVASVAKAKADVENTAAQVTVSQTLLGRAAVRSPIDGVVLDRKVSLGQTVAASFQTPVLFTLASDLSMMQLAVDIDEADIGLVHEGDKASFGVDAYPQRRFNATLVSLRNAPRTTNGVVTYQGVLAVDNSAGLLRPGLTATADILVQETKDALLVPNGALRFTPSAKQAAAPALPPAKDGELLGRVWVLENAKPAPRDLRIGHTDGRSTEVLSGALKPAESVITDTATHANGA